MWPPGSQDASTVLSPHLEPREDNWARWDMDWIRPLSSVTDLFELGKDPASVGLWFFTCKRKILDKH